MVVNYELQIVNYELHYELQTSWYLTKKTPSQAMMKLCFLPNFYPTSIRHAVGCRNPLFIQSFARYHMELSNLSEVF